MRIEESEGSTEHVEECIDDVLHSSRHHPPLLSHNCKELAGKDSSIWQDEPYQLHRSVYHRSHTFLPLGIWVVRQVRTRGKFPYGSWMHRTPIHLLYMVDETPQKRTS